MEADRFDALVRSIETYVPRRTAIGGIAAGLVLLSQAGSEEGAAKKHKHKKKKHKGGGVQC